MKTPPDKHRPYHVGSFSFDNGCRGLKHRIGRHDGKHHRTSSDPYCRHREEQCICGTSMDLRRMIQKILLDWAHKKLLWGDRFQRVWDVLPQDTDELEPFY